MVPEIGHQQEYTLFLFFCRAAASSNNALQLIPNRAFGTLGTSEFER